MRAIPVDVGTAVGYLDLDISGFISGFKTAQQEAEQRSKSMSEQIGQGFTTAGKGLTTAGSSLTKTVTVPIMAAGAAAIKTTADFDSAMSKVSAISGATGDDFDALRDKAIEMGAKTKFSATESAEAFTYMAMAGWKTEEMLQGIDGIMALSAADGLDLATTSDIVTDALTAFGLQAGDAGHFADVLAQASRNANTNVAMMGESFKYVGPVAGSMGYSVEDVSVALGLMANSGIKASQAGTSLRQALSQMINPTDDAAELMDKYGLSLFDSEGNAKDLMSVMVDLRGTFGGVQLDVEKAAAAAEAGDEAWAEYASSLPISEQEKLQSLVEIFGVRSMPAMLAIINAGEDDFNNLAAAISNADGTAQQMADTMLNNLKGQITILKSNLETLAIQIGDILMPYISRFVSRLQDFVIWLQNLDEGTKQNIIRFALFAAAIGPILLVLGKLLTGVGNLFFAFNNIKKGITGLRTSLGLLKGAFGGISAPVIAIVAIIGVLIAAFKHLWDTNEEFRNKISGIWEGIKETFNNFCQGIVDRLNALGFQFQDITDVIKGVWEAFCSVLAPIFEGAFQAIGVIFETVLNVLLGIFDFWSAVFTGDWEGAWSAISGIFQSIWEGIVQLLTTILETIWNVIKTVWNGIKDDVTRIVNDIKTKVTNVFNNLRQWLSNTWNNVKTFTSNAWTNIRDKISTSIDTARQKVQSGIDTIKNKFTEGFNAARDTVSGVFDSIHSKISSIMEGARNIVTNAISAIRNAFNFSWSLPHLSLPHISISGRFSLSPPSVPHFSISWYAKAMRKGMILDRPTIFGFDPKSGQFMGAGEAGSETIVGTKSLMEMITDAVRSAIGNLEATIASYCASLGDMFLTSVQGIRAIVGQAYDLAIAQSERGSGSFDFNYDLLADKLVEILRKAPIKNDVKVEMRDGDVYLDNERVGRKVAPVVSRVVTTG